MKKIHLLCTLFSLTLLLTGCMTSHKKDGPPQYPVDISKIRDAVPQKVKLSRIGNKPFYTVRGNKYYVMRSSKNYSEVGIASWYGTLFHEHRTSNGEKYDMLAMTAAHRNLPLPTFVSVTNLENGKKIIVKVNDRGPFKPHRIIDLSYVAAKKLGMTGRGTALVEVKAIDLDAKKPGNQYYLQVGKFSQKSKATCLQHRVARLTHNHPSQIKSFTKNHHQFYQLRIGPIKDKYTADRMANNLKSIGLGARIDYTI